jgi:hypothetical protein
MNPLPLALLAVLALVASARSQEEDAPAPLVLPATARILGDISDGTPPAPQPPKPVFVVPPSDILATTTQQQGGRTITLQRIKPIALPPPPEPAPPVDIHDPANQERLAAFRQNHPRTDLVFLGATVFRSEHSPSRSRVQIWPLLLDWNRPHPNNRGAPVAFWSSADFGYLSGLAAFVGTDGAARSLILSWGALNLDRTSTRRVEKIPVFPTGPATFIIDGEQPDAETLIVIQSLHDLYNNEYARLKTAYEGRERARIEREAYLKAHPPQPKNIVLNYWRTEKSAPAKGANQ